MTMSGYSGEFNVPLFCLFCLLRPHPFPYVAFMSRMSVTRLENIDESVLAFVGAVLFCPICSVAQSYRELCAVGVPPGRECSAMI